MSMCPIRDQEAAEKLSILDDKQNANRDSTFIWVRMDSGAANHVCDPRRHFLNFITHRMPMAGNVLPLLEKVLNMSGQRM